MLNTLVYPQAIFHLRIFLCSCCIIIKIGPIMLFQSKRVISFGFFIPYFEIISIDNIHLTNKIDLYNKYYKNFTFIKY